VIRALKETSFSLDGGVVLCGYERGRFEMKNWLHEKSIYEGIIQKMKWAAAAAATMKRKVLSSFSLFGHYGEREKKRKISSSVKARKFLSLRTIAAAAMAHKKSSSIIAFLLLSVCGGGDGSSDGGKKKNQKRKEYFTILLGGSVVLYDWFLHSANSQLHRIQNSFLFIIISLTSLSRSLGPGRGERSDARSNTLNSSLILALPARVEILLWREKNV
jgi:hypothetical protein